MNSGCRVHNLYFKKFFLSFYYENFQMLRKYWKNSMTNTIHLLSEFTCYRFASLASCISASMHPSSMHAFQNRVYLTPKVFSVHLLRIRTLSYISTIPFSHSRKFTVIPCPYRTSLPFPKCLFKAWFSFLNQDPLWFSHFILFCLFGLCSRTVFHLHPTPTFKKNFKLHYFFFFFFNKLGLCFVF